MCAPPEPAPLLVLIGPPTLLQGFKLTSVVMWPCFCFMLQTGWFYRVKNHTCHTADTLSTVQRSSACKSKCATKQDKHTCKYISFIFNITIECLTQRPITIISPETKQGETVTYTKHIKIKELEVFLFWLSVYKLCLNRSRKLKGIAHPIILFIHSECCRDMGCKERLKDNKTGLQQFQF